MRSISAPHATSLAISLVLGSSAASAQTSLDLIAIDMQASQAIQTGSTTLSAGRSTLVRVVVRALGTIPPGALYDGRLRVYAGGVEIPGSPFYSANGPLTPSPTVNPNDLESTLNFVFLPPEGNDVELLAEVNPEGTTQIEEVDYGNNTLQSGVLDFQCRGNAELAFVPIDYRPFGGSVPNLPDPELIKPGVGDNFVQAIYPAGDWEYHRSDAPSKLWASSLSSSSDGTALASLLAADMLLMNPVPDFIYGWVPGGLPYNGVALSIPGVAAIGNTELIRFQRTFAHELGHLFGLQHNSATTNTIGLDVEHHLAITQELPQLQPASKKDIMYAGLLTHEAWVWEPSYDVFHANQAFACAPSPAAPVLAAAPPRFLVAGVHAQAKHSLTITAALAARSAALTPFVPLARADLILRVEQAGAAPVELGILTQGSADLCGASDVADADSEEPLSVGGFAVLLPAAIDAAALERITFLEPGSALPLAELTRSASAPAGAITALTPLADGRLELTFEAADADGDALSAYVRYSHDGERQVPLGGPFDGTSLVIDVAELPTLEPGRGYLELLLSDGLRTSALRYAPPAGDPGPLAGSANAPWVNVLTPDNGKTYPRGATVILHSSGWDLEDRALGGASIRWSSSLDGALGTGRLTSTQDLSVGVHTLTVEAVDSLGLQSFDAVTITITDRELPGQICQTDIGFGGPGASRLTICGGDLSPGSSIDVELSGAAPLAPALIAVSHSLTPTALFGGTLVPVPIEIVILGQTNALGTWLLPQTIPGGVTAEIFAQAGYVDAALPGGVGFSNAVRLDP
jgi:hypothetical protein